MKLHKKRRLSRSSLFVTLAGLLLFCLFIRYPDTVQEAALTSLTLSSHKTIPSLFPTAVLARLLTACLASIKRADRTTGLTERLFSLPTISVFSIIFGMVFGFPNGVVSAYILFENGQVSESEAARLAAFTNNASLAFVVITIPSVFKNPLFAPTLFLSQTLSSLIVGFFLAKKDKKTSLLPPSKFLAVKKAPSLIEEATEAIVKSGYAMLSLTSFSLFFSVTSAVTAELFSNKALEIALLVFLEPISFIFKLSAFSKNELLTLSLSAFALGFSGLSVIMQSYTASNGRLPTLFFALTRLAIGFLSALLAPLLLTAIKLLISFQ